MRQRPQALSQSQTLIWRAVMKTVENLAFKGGGVLGTAYVGALQALEEYKLAGSLKPTNGSPIVYGKVKRVAGTSAGAICAALVALGNNAKEIDGIMDSMKFTDLVDVDKDFPANGGLCLGISFLNWMEAQVKAIMKKDHATFIDLFDLARENPLYKDLHVFSHQVASGRTFEFSAQSTPHVPISQAVRASMSIPMFYVPWQFGGDLQDSYPGEFVDGGVAFNYPISAFDSGQPAPLTIGIFLTPLSYTTQGPLDTLMHYILNCYNCSEELKAFAEAMFELIKLGPYNDSNVKQLQSQVSLSAAPGATQDVKLVFEIIAALGAAWALWEYNGDIEAAIEEFETLLDDWLENIPGWDELVKFLKLVELWGSAIGSVLNTPTNFVFERDAQRSIVLNTLGYSFIDFWMPECNKMKLRAAGYNSAEKYLSLIMYS
jgi:predicted acylesterase/phospholipase RssA